jgi:hypothetical protein
MISSSNPSGTGVPVTFTATVTAQAPSAAAVGAGGTVTFSRNGFALSNCTNVALNASGQATCIVTFTIAGNYNMVASYAGNTNFNASTSTTLVQQALGPTAAPVGISGRVKDASGNGVHKARVIMQNQQGEQVWAMTNPFGYYRFASVQSGQLYFLSVQHKRLQFQPRSVTVVDELTDFDFVADPVRPAGGSKPPSN